MESLCVWRHDPESPRQGWIQCTKTESEDWMPKTDDFARASGPIRKPKAENRKPKTESRRPKAKKTVGKQGTKTESRESIPENRNPKNGPWRNLKETPKETLKKLRKTLKNLPETLEETLKKPYKNPEQPPKQPPKQP